MAFFAVFAAIGFGRYGYSAVLPSMQKSLGLTSAASGSLASWNLAGYTIMALVGGVLAWRFGPRAVVTIGLIVTAVGMFLTGLSGGLLSASAARLLTGMGNGMVVAPAVSLMATWFDARRLGIASGIVPSGSPLAFVVVGPVVPRIIAGGGADGWRLAWYFFAAITAVIAVLTLIVLRNRPHGATLRVTQTRAGLPDFKAILRSRHAWHLGFVYMLYGFAFLIFFTFFQKRLTVDLGYSSEAAGNLFLVVGIVGVVSGILWGSVSDRVGRGRAVAMTFVLEACAALVFSLSHSAAALAIAAAVFGFSAFSMPGLIGAACGDRFGAGLASTSLGFVTAFMGVGQAIGPIVGGSMEDAFSSLGPSYLLSAVVFVIGAGAALLLRDARPGSSRRGVRQHKKGALRWKSPR